MSAAVAMPGRPAERTFPFELFCTSFTPAMHAGSLLGFVDIRLPGGIELRDLRICRSDGGLYIYLPRRPERECGGDGFAHFPDGSLRLTRPVAIPDPDDRAPFTAAVLRAVRARFPDALPI